MRNRRRKLDRKSFLVQLRRQFPISLIYYPGCGYDRILESAFEQKEIAYLDWNYEKGDNRFNFVLGNYGRSPFRDHVFDALFYQDIHTDRYMTMEILRTLRPGGIVISSIYSGHPVDFSTERLREMQGLTRVHLPFPNKYYTVFQKSPIIT